MDYNRWSEYRRRRRFAFWYVVGGLLLLAVLLPFLAGTSFNVLKSILIIMWFVGSIVMSFRMGGFRCPRCGERFFEGDSHHNGFAKHCLHCGLQKYEEA